ncbi:DUF3426 domain-containing protein [Arenicella sp. 4NH20-0111]|uniref:zinc-ribbon and DUF3426 domain-containing protein n=1 Tax=Arenicella sp. 4NH20-0111 TaxID=3127648 RepID=UPI00310C4617
MAFHTTQCPHCFTDYTISDEQYRTSEGMVRCGTCREQFKARLIDSTLETPKFDPRDTFIEPLSEPLKARDGGDIELSKEPEPSYVSYEKPLDDTEQPFELLSTHEFEYTGPKESVPEDVLEEYGNSQELSTSEILNNLKAKQSKDSTYEPATDTASNSIVSSNVNESITHGQLDLELPLDSKKAEATHERREPELEQKDNRLIDEVDKLVDEKIIPPTGARQAQVTTTQANEPIKRSIKHTQKKKNQDDFFLQPRKKANTQKRGVGWWLTTLFGIVITLILLISLIYQLWLKQLIDMPTDQTWFNSVQKSLSPISNTLDRLASDNGVTLPQRRNLRKLELVSAKTQPHPTRSTTILLKVSLINHADISQSLPWLEMSLTDADGRLVARRNLSPKSYIYNNKTNSIIGSNELKKITIELLSFPKSATGYEIKLLDN